MFERFNKDACVAVGNSQEIARSLRHANIHIEHFLLSLLITPESPAATLLEKYGVTYDVVRRFYPAATDQPKQHDHMGLVPQVQLVVRTARSIVHKTDGDRADVQDLHLLLGLFCIDDNAATKLLKQLGCDQQTLCNEIASKLGIETPFAADSYRLPSAEQRRQAVLGAIDSASEDQLRQALTHTIIWLNDAQLQRVERNLTAIRV